MSFARFSCRYAYYKAQNDDGGAYEASIKAQLKDVEAKLANIMSAIEAGIFTATTAERMNVLENQKSMLRDALLAEQNRKKYDLKPETVLRFLEAYVGDINNPQTTQRLLDFLVSGIYVYPDKLAMTFYFTDDCREFSFADMKELFENQQRIADLMNDRSNLQKTPLTEKMLASLIDDTDTAEGTDDPDFFP